MSETNRRKKINHKTKEFRNRDDVPENIEKFYSYLCSRSKNPTNKVMKINSEGIAEITESKIFYALTSMKEQTKRCKEKNRNKRKNECKFDKLYKIEKKKLSLPQLETGRYETSVNTNF